MAHLNPRKAAKRTSPIETTKHPFILPECLFGTGHCQSSVQSINFKHLFCVSLLPSVSPEPEVRAAPRARDSGVGMCREYTIFNSVLLFHFETFPTNFPSTKSISSKYSSIRKWMISDSRKKSPFFIERVNALSLSRCAWSGFTRTFCINFFINFILVRPCSYILYTCNKEYKSLVDD